MTGCGTNLHVGEGEQEREGGEGREGGDTGEMTGGGTNLRV